MQCNIPDSLPWHHAKYTNTCTLDNFLMVMLLYAKQNPDFVLKFGSSEVEDNLKSSILLMLDGALEKGRTHILEYFHSRLDIQLSSKAKKYDFFGDEYSRCLCLFSHVWKLTVQLACDSPHCPNQVTTRFPSTFSFSRAAAFEEQIS